MLLSKVWQQNFLHLAKILNTLREWMCGRSCSWVRCKRFGCRESSPRKCHWYACVGVCVCVFVCMIIISPYRLRHWLRLHDDKRLYYSMQGSVGQLNLQLSVSMGQEHTPSRAHTHEGKAVLGWCLSLMNLTKYQPPPIHTAGTAHAQ